MFRYYLSQNNAMVSKHLAGDVFSMLPKFPKMYLPCTSSMFEHLLNFISWSFQCLNISPQPSQIYFVCPSFSNLFFFWSFSADGRSLTCELNVELIAPQRAPAGAQSSKTWKIHKFLSTPRFQTIFWKSQTKIQILQSLQDFKQLLNQKCPVQNLKNLSTHGFFLNKNILCS